ncbi:hypothetical protein VCR3J2_80375 [Vibrio coralliirubri]|nr:hypothetical protein VCR3J2_80375 [Vibrio coralliirubri]
MAVTRFGLSFFLAKKAKHPFYIELSQFKRLALYQIAVPISQS